MYFTVERFPLAKVSVKTLVPVLEAPVTVMLTVSERPVSRVTVPLKPATLLANLGRPEKLYPLIVRFDFLPLVTEPETRTAFAAVVIVTVVAADVALA